MLRRFLKDSRKKYEFSFEEMLLLLGIQTQIDYTNSKVKTTCLKMSGKNTDGRIEI